MYAFARYQVSWKQITIVRQAMIAPSRRDSRVDLWTTSYQQAGDLHWISSSWLFQVQMALTWLVPICFGHLDIESACVYYYSRYCSRNYEKPPGLNGKR
jgi:hypothetical protein